jgi:hypothetical protein
VKYLKLQMGKKAMSAQGYGMLAVIGGIATYAGVHFSDRAINYAQTDARVAVAKTDCYVKSSSYKIEDKNTGDLLYVSCNVAPELASHFGMQRSDIKKRVAVKYIFKSPVDGSEQSGEFEDSNATSDYSVGSIIKIYAHTTDPATSERF